MVVEDLGCVDLDLRLSWLVGQYCSCFCPGRMVVHLISRHANLGPPHHYGHPVPFSHVTGMAPVQERKHWMERIFQFPRTTTKSPPPACQSVIGPIPSLLGGGPIFVLKAKNLPSVIIDLVTGSLQNRLVFSLFYTGDISISFW